MLPSLIVIAILGILVGGLINVLADDLPRRRAPRLPHYSDDTPRPPAGWLGITAFLSGKRASPTGARLSWRHPLVEIGTALLWVIAVLASQSKPGMTDLQVIFWLAYMAIFMLITVIDLEHRLILFVVIIPSMILALVDALVTPYGASLTNALIGAAVGFGVFFALYLGGFLFTYVLSRQRGEQINEVAFGYGDVLLITLSGLILGWQPLIFAMFITVFLGALGAILYLAARALAGGRYTLFTPLPYGQYIIIGTVIMMLFSTEIGVMLR